MPRLKQFDENEILDKAMKLFWKKGFFATSMQDIVNELGINRASLYDTFGGKQELYNKAFSRYIKEAQEKICAYFENTDDVKGAFQKLFEDLILDSVNDYDKRGCFMVNAASEMIPNHMDMCCIMSGYKNFILGLFTTQVEKAMENNNMSGCKSAQAIANYLFTYFNGLRLISKIYENPKDLKCTIHVALSVLD